MLAHGALGVGKARAQVAPAGALIDLNSGTPVTPGLYTQYSASYTPQTSGHYYVLFAFREDPSYFSFDDAVFAAHGSSSNLLANPGFEGGTTPSQRVSYLNLPLLWGLAYQTGNVPPAAGTVNGYNPHSGTHAWYDGSVGSFDGIYQVLTLQAGQAYDLSFWLTSPSNFVTGVNGSGGIEVAAYVGSCGSSITTCNTSLGTGFTVETPPVLTAIATTGGDLAANVFSLASSAAQQATVVFDGGTLRMTGGNFANNIITAPVTIGAANGTVDTSTGSGGFSGTVSGAGSLTISGGGSFILAGANTYAGGTILDGGTLAVANAAALGTGSLSMAPGTTLAFLNSLNLSTPIAFTAAADPTIDTGTNSVTLSGVISGPGDLTKIGSGALDLAAINTYTGATTVAQGTLLVDGSIGNSFVTVQSGAILGGRGTIGSIALQSGAVLAPGAGTPFSTLTILGNAAFAAGSVFMVTANAAGQSDKLIVGGTAALNGATLAINTPGALIGPNTRFDILSAAGGITGRFASVISSSNSAFLAPFLIYSGNDITLGFVPTAAFTSAAATPNQRGVAAAIQSLGAGNRLFDGVVGQDAAGARQAFQTASAETHASATTASINAGRVTSSILFDRLWNLPIPQAGDALDALKQFEPHNVPALLNCYAPVTAPATSAPPAAHGYTVWGQAIGDFGGSRGDGNAAAVDRTLGGFMLGLDTRVDAKGLENWRVGVAGGYTNTQFDVKSGGGAGTFENVFGSVYAGARYGAVTLRLGGTYGGTQTNMRRTVAFPGFFETERSNNGGDTGQVFGELGYRFSWPVAVIEPILNGSYTHTHQDAYREKGGVAALAGAAQDVDVESTVLGVRSEILPFATLPIVARLFLGWQHTYGDINPAATVAFASGGLSFASYGTPIDRNAVVAEAGLDYRATSALSLGLTYFGQAGERSHDNAVKGRVEYRF